MCDLKAPHETQRCEQPTEVKITGISVHSVQLKKPLTWGVKRVRDRATSPASFDSYISLSLSLLSSLHPLTLSHCWVPDGMNMFVAHSCLFSCLRPNICTPSGNNKVDLHLPFCPIYLMQRNIYDNPPTVTSGSFYHLFTMCTLFWISTNGKLNSCLWPNSKGEIVFIPCLSVFLELTNCLHHHHLFPVTLNMFCFCSIVAGVTISLSIFKSCWSQLLIEAKV